MAGLVLDRRTIRLIAIAFVLLASLSIHRLFFAVAPHSVDVMVIHGETMGTTYQIRVAGEGLDEKLRHQIESETARRLTAVDQWMSNWNPDSEVVRFNRHHDIGDFPVSSETAKLVAFAIELNGWSEGAFDIGVGPLVRLWGFGHGAIVDAPPSDDLVASLIARLGKDRLRVGVGVSTSSAFLGKNDPLVEIDLSAIAKGFGVDHVAEGLERLGRVDYLVEIGGEVRAGGNRPGGGPWRVGIERPQNDGRSVQSIIALRDQAMATSGDYRIFYVEKGSRVAHTIDPRTGRPVENGPASVSVVANSAAEADAWATALMVLGEERGLALADEHEIGAFMLFRDKNGAIVERPNALFPSRESPGEAIQ